MLTNSAFERLLDKWIAEGRVAADQRAALAGDVAAAGQMIHPATLTAVFGAALGILAALAFVAANWQVMPPALRLATLAGGLGLCYGGAIILLGRGQAFGHALLLLGAGLFGASLALVSQMYHVGGSLSALLGLWGGGALATAVAARSRGPLWLAGLAFVWMGLEGDGVVTWTALGLLGLTAAPALAWRLRGEVLALQLGALALVYGRIDFEYALLPMLAVHLAAWAGAAVVDNGRRAWPGPVQAVQKVAALVLAVIVSIEMPATEAPVAVALATVLLAALAGHLAWRAQATGRLEPGEAQSLGVVAALTVTALAMPAAAMSWLAPAALLAVAVRLAVLDAGRGRKGRLALAVGLFLSQAAVVYLRTDGSLMATSLFFLVGGLILAGISLRAGRHLGRETP